MLSIHPFTQFCELVTAVQSEVGETHTDTNKNEIIITHVPDDIVTTHLSSPSNQNYCLFLTTTR